MDWMERALKLAEKGRRSTSPNPMVGACVVRKGRLLGEGYHRRFGGDHAEVDALKAAGSRCRGATLYVTLEPCVSWGKTPPCVNAIVQARICRVVVAALDPNPRNHGKGVAALRRSGLEVRTGVLGREAAAQNEAFFKYVRTGLPFVTLKMAQSIDGKIATAKGQSRWISSPASLVFVHRLRAEQDAIMVGTRTLFLDNPRLTPRVPAPGRDPQKPWRVVLDADCRIRPWARVLKGPQLTLVAVSERVLKSISNKHAGSKKSITLLGVPEKRGRLNLRVLLGRLASLGVAKLLVEGGGELAWSLLSEGLADRAYWTLAPKIIGGRSAKTSVEGDGIRDLSRPIRASFTRIERLGDDVLIRTDF